VKNSPALKGLTIPRTGRPAGRIGTLVTKMLSSQASRGSSRRRAASAAPCCAYDKATGKEVGAVHPRLRRDADDVLPNGQRTSWSRPVAARRGELLAFKLPGS
jgi:quinoprotein glucose dehydrogenase